jgi:1,4-dihydroxy-2-naphthoyl-CoA hydrolase
MTAMSEATPTPEQILAAIPPSALDLRMGIEVVEVSAERVVARMPVEGNTQPFGLLHGGASCVLAESVGSIAANVHGAPTHYAVGIEISCSHHSGARSGYVTATATPLKAGRQVATYHVEITDDAGTPVATARLSCMLRPRPTQA